MINFSIDKLRRSDLSCILSSGGWISARDVYLRASLLSKIQISCHLRIEHLCFVFGADCLHETFVLFSSSVSLILILLWHDEFLSQLVAFDYQKVAVERHRDELSSRLVFERRRRW